MLKVGAQDPLKGGYAKKFKLDGLEGGGGDGGGL